MGILRGPFFLKKSTHSLPKILHGLKVDAARSSWLFLTINTFYCIIKGWPVLKLSCFFSIDKRPFNTLGEETGKNMYIGLWALTLRSVANSGNKSYGNYRGNWLTKLKNLNNIHSIMWMATAPIAEMSDDKIRKCFPKTKTKKASSTAARAILDVTFSRHLAIGTWCCSRWPDRYHVIHLFRTYS